MFRLLTLTALLLTMFQFNSYGQESYGKTLNLGLGVGGQFGYYKYVGNYLPVLHIDYEFDVAKNFTLAPFINIHTYTKSYYWGNNNNPFKDYGFREITGAMGIKGAYYLDDILKAGSKWDFYLAGSLGFVAVSSRWDSDYNGDKEYFGKPNPLFLDLHIGTEYHVNNQIGLFLDLSPNATTLGLAIHGK